MVSGYPDWTLPIVVIGTVTVTGSVTVSGPVTISTLAADNIIIDKLTVGAYTERRSTLSNDNGVTTPTAPPDYLTGTTYRGKFFPRGCRGLMLSLSIYCKRTGAGTLTLSYSPQPGMGAVGSIIITPSASWNWQSTAVNMFWNYDSLFIWVSACSADVSYGRDVVAPYDYAISTDSGATWYTVSYRLFIRADMAEQTVGDIPVSGTLNTIEIPSLTGNRICTSLSVPPLSTLYDTIQVGAGEVLIVIFWLEDTEPTNNLVPLIRCDGQQVLPLEMLFYAWNRDIISDSTPGITIGKWDTVNTTYTIIVTIPFPFKRSLEVGYYNSHASAYQAGSVAYSWKKIS